jgi:hypothetical protein
VSGAKNLGPAVPDLVCTQVMHVQLQSIAFVLGILRLQGVLLQHTAAYASATSTA